jgi:flagellar basal body-associated protein FliL
MDNLTPSSSPMPTAIPPATSSRPIWVAVIVILLLAIGVIYIFSASRAENDEALTASSTDDASLEEIVGEIEEFDVADLEEDISSLGK